MKKYMLSLVALVVAVAAMAFTNVEKPVEVEVEAAAVQFQFLGSDMEDVYDLEQWAEIEDGGPGCTTGNLPCVVTVQSGTLSAWLNARDHAKIINDATTRKN